MKRLSALALALVFVLAQGCLGGPVAGAQPLGGQEQQLRLDIGRLTPRMVTPGDKDVTVTATVTNTSDSRISDLIARLQVGAPLSSDEEFSEALSTMPSSDAASSEWGEVRRSLAPGETASFRLTVPTSELGLTGPGVYPLLVNVNGTPDAGAPARLAQLDVLLPVIDPPSEVPPASVSMLWPITASQPKVIDRLPDGRPVLSDDDLAAELQPGGRLDALVNSAASKRDSPLFTSLCFAVDPDLLDTVSAMTRGYLVDTPEGRVPGSGGKKAATWLASLKNLVAGHCVVQVPYADADLTALTRVRTDTDLVGQALRGSSILSTLGVQQRGGVVWTSGGLTGEAARRSARAGVDTVIAGPETTGSTSTTTGTSTVAGTDVRVLSYDSLVSSALHGYTSQGTSAVTPAQQPNVATQNGIAAVAFRGGLGAEVPQEPVLVAPPHGWDAPVGEFDALLGSLETMRSAGMVQPTALEDLLTAPAAGNSTVGGAPALGGESEVGPFVLDELSQVEDTAADLRKAMSVDSTRQVQPDALINPLHDAVVRATSTAWQTNDRRREAAADATGQVDTLKDGVTVATPTQSVTLASGSSPLPVTLANRLPVAVTVRLNVSNYAGLKLERPPGMLLAANSSVPRWIPAEALRSGRFTLDVSLETPQGTPLGATTRLELQSNEFGLFTVILTSVAGGALVLLSGRRIYQRVRAKKAG